LHYSQQWSINHIHDGTRIVQLCLVQYEALYSALQFLPAPVAGVAQESFSLPPLSPQVFHSQTCPLVFGKRALNSTGRGNPRRLNRSSLATSGAGVIVPLNPKGASNGEEKSQEKRQKKEVVS
jgi:hypothetical protein